MKYIAALDYEHLDNGMFLTALARSISQQEGVQPIIVHGDSEYTDRIMQSGVMREDAKIRSIKGLNHRLINLLADEGVSAVGISGHQRRLITLKNEELSLDASFFERLPAGPALLMSTLVWNIEAASPQPIPLSTMVTFLSNQFNAERIYAFTKADKDEILINDKPDELSWQNMPEEFVSQNLPKEFKDFNQPMHLSTARDFNTIPEDNHSIFIR